MQKIFNQIVSEINRRNILRLQIEREFNLIRGDKLAAEIDLFACFYTAETGEPRGSIGRLIDRHRNAFLANLARKVHTENVEVFHLPASLGTTISRENFAREKNEFDVEKLAEKEELRLEVETNGMDFIDHEPESFPDSMTLLYVDDFFKVLAEDVQDPLKLLKISAYVGDGEASLAIVRALRNLPDYSGHFPPRPPRDGNKKKDYDLTPPTIIHGLRPGLA